jgi:hypothetical protein
MPHQGALPNQSGKPCHGTSGGASVSSAGSTTQTYWINVAAPWLTNATGGVRVEISLAPAADTSSAFLPLNWVQSFKVSPGDRVAALSK